MMKSYVGNFGIVSPIDISPGDSHQRIMNHELEIFAISKTTAICLLSDIRSGAVVMPRKCSAIS